MGYAEILAELRKLETIDFRSVPERQEAQIDMTYDAVVALLMRLAQTEK